MRIFFCCKRTEIKRFNYESYSTGSELPKLCKKISFLTLKRREIKAFLKVFAFCLKNSNKTQIKSILTFDAGVKGYQILTFILK